MESDLKYRLDYGHMPVFGPNKEPLRDHAPANARADSGQTLFWRDTEGKRAVQPWRRKLWDLQNKIGRD